MDNNVLGVEVECCGEGVCQKAEPAENGKDLYIKSLQQENENLRNQLKVTEEDRDETKKALGKATIDLMKLQAEKEGKTFEQYAGEVGEGLHNILYGEPK